MWFRSLSLFGFWGSIILLCISSNHCFFFLWVFTLPPILFCFLPFSLPSLSGKWRSGSITSSSAQVFCHRVAQPVPLILLIESWLLWMLHLSQDVILSIEIPGGQYLVAWMIFSETSWKASRKETSEQTNQLGIMTIHPTHAYQHGSGRGLQNDALPASAGSRVMMSLKSLWPVTQELR